MLKSRTLEPQNSDSLQSTPARGSDTLRVWAAGVDYTRDASIGPSSIEQASELLRKLRSSMRFIIGNTSRAPPPALADVELSIVRDFLQIFSDEPGGEVHSPPAEPA